MATELISLDLKGLPRWSELTESMHERASDLSAVFEAGDEAFRVEMNQQFRTEGEYFLGKKWAPLSPAYAARKPTPPPPFGILYRSGELWKSLTDESHEDHVKVITPTSGTYGTAIPYAKYHQQGTPKMPQRKVIEIRKRLKAWFMRATIGHILSGKLPGSDDA